jgi:peptidoglycan/LPS O-acetylase OafA/YrhL
MRVRARNHQFDALRIVFATLVLLSHAFELTDGSASRELLSRATHGATTFGGFAVDGFFLLSGFLIVQSWDKYPHFWDFLSKRLLRIVPGYAVAIALSTLAAGTLAPGQPGFFAMLVHGHTGMRFWASVGMLGSPEAPQVYPGMSHRLVNGSLWTIPYEFHCYLLVALFGAVALRRRRAAWLATTAVLLILTSSVYLKTHLEWTRAKFVLGDPASVYRMGAAFFFGGCFYLFRDRIRLRASYAVVAVVLTAVVSQWRPEEFEVVLIVCGGYAMFQWASTPRRGLAWMAHCPDISYGIYLYGWPVECLWIWWHGGSPWVTFFVSTIVCFGLGWLSWHWVEHPALKLKRHPTARESGLPSRSPRRPEAVPSPSTSSAALP